MSSANDLDPRIRARMGKLLELARQGVGGEKDNAGRQLERMLAKHGLTVDDLLDEAKREWVEFKFKDRNQHDLLVQIICATLNVTSFSSRQSRRSLFIELTPAEAADVKVRYEIYSKEFAPYLQRQIDAARRAFFTVNRIFPQRDDDGDDEKPKTSLTEEEIEEIMAMARKLRPVPIHRQIEGPK